jgi:tape measure domain-containing protein
MQMARNIDIAISAKDNFSDALKKMQRNQTAFRKDLGQLQSELDKFNKNKIDLKTDFIKAKKELQEAEKNFKKLGDEMSRQKMEAAQLNYDNVKRNLDLVSSSARKTEKDMKSLTNTMSKADNRAGFGSSGGMLGSIGKAGMYKMLGDTASQIANTYVASAFGSEAGTVFGSALSGAASGAAIGSIIPGIGTAVGAVAGTVIGTIQGATEVYQKRDDAFKSTVRSEFDRVTGEQKGALQGGSDAAAMRELIGARGEVVFGGAEESKRILADVQQFALETPFNYDMMAQQAVNLRTAGVANEDIMLRLKQIGDLSMGNAAAFESIARQFTQATAKGKAQTQDLRIMAEAGVPIYEALAAVKNTDVAGVFELLEDGALYIKDLNDAFAYLTGEGGRMNDMLNQLAGSFAMLTEQRAEVDELLNVAMGEGFNEKRKEGLQAQIDFMSGEMGDKMKEAYSMMGAFQADLENQREQILRDSLTKTMETDEYKKAIEEGNAAEAGKLIAQAKVEAEIAYKDTDGFKLQLQADKDLVQSTRDALADDWYNYGYSMEQEFNKGRAAAKNYDASPSGYYTSGGSPLKGNPVTGGFMGKAFGLSYVPYDNYPALLHQGERVLTASEARSGSGGNISISFGNVTVREEADINKIAELMVRELKYAKAGNIA